MGCGYLKRVSLRFVLIGAGVSLSGGPLHADPPSPCGGFLAHEACGGPSSPSEFPNPPVHYAGTPHVKIPKEYIGKELLLHVAAAPQPQLPMSSSIQSKIVIFEVDGAMLVLRQSPRGQAITGSVRQNLLLARFPIVDQDNASFTFDFNGGMSQLPLSTNLHCSDFLGTHFDDTSQKIKLAHSFISSIQGVAGRTAIRQVALTDASLWSGATESQPLEISYFFSEYTPDPTFPTSKNHNFLQYGFMETPPILKNGETHVYAAKFHPQKPIVFAISPDTPAPYRDTIKAGILYWNRAFGDTRIQVIDAPEGVQAPDLLYNVVQWVPWDTYGSSNADFLMDPLTGEILHAMAHISSFFVKDSLKKAEDSLWGLKDVGKGGGALRARHLLAKAKGASALLSGDILKALLSSQDISEDSELLAKNALAAVVAHEIGHTLGLRHNFAGAQAISYPSHKRTEILAQLVANGGRPPEGVRPGSTLMDYTAFLETALMGGMILFTDDVLPYDKAAIEALYFDKIHAAKKTPTFCTDSHLGLLQDCQVFSKGKNVVESAAESYQYASEHIVYSFLNKIIEQKKKGKKDRGATLDTLFLDPSGLLESLLAPQESLLMLYTRKGFTAGVAKNFPFMAHAIFSLPANSHQLKEVRVAERKALKKDLDEVGGLESVFALLPEDFVKTSVKHLNGILASKHWIKKLEQESIEITKSELTLIKKLAKTFFADFQMGYNTSLLKLLGGQPLSKIFSELEPLEDDEEDEAWQAAQMLPPFENTELSQDLADHLGGMVAQILLGRLGPDERDVPRLLESALTGNPPYLGMSTFLYDPALRILASKVFGVGNVCRGEVPSWGIEQRLQVAEGLVKLAQSSGLPEEALALKSSEYNWIHTVQTEIGFLQKITCVPLVSW